MPRKRRLRNPNPVRPRRRDERKYEQIMRREYLDPLYHRILSRMARSNAANEAIRAMGDVVAEMNSYPDGGVPVVEIRRQMARIEGYHRERLISTFRSAIGVNILPFLSEPLIAQQMREIVAENVSLIRTIPKRFHDGVRADLLDLIQTRPFDQQALKDVMRKNYRSSGYNLRRITRDQTSKTVGKLTEVRNAQLGVEQYQWVTSQDERVRPTHVANSGRIFAWSDPPPETGHPGDDVQCRCVSIPILTPATADRLQGAGTHSITDIDVTTPGAVTPPSVVQPPPPPPPPLPKPQKPPAGGESLTWAQIDRAAWRSKEELKYHEHPSMWGDRRSVSARAAASVEGMEGSVVHRTKKSAWFRWTDQQIEMNGHGNSAYGDRFVWMHEFGHYIDNAIETKNKMSSSSDGASFNTARRAEGSRMRKGSGKGAYDVYTGLRGNGFNKPLNDEAADFMKLTAPERRKLLDEMGNTVGFTADEFDELVSRHGYKFITNQKGINLSDELNDALAYRFMRALEENDVQGAMDTITFGQRSLRFWLTNQAGIDADLYREIQDAAFKHARGALSMVSDICDAITTGKISIGYGHGPAYWRRGQEWRNNEIFANITSLDADDEYTRKLAKRLFPNMYDEVIGSMKQYLDDIGNPYTDESTSALEEYKEIQMKSKLRKKKIATGGK